MDPLQPGCVAWAELGDGIGREQSGRRPVIVISSRDHLLIADELVTTVPATTSDRRWPNHIELRGPTGLKQTSYAMTEQAITISRTRLVRGAGTVDQACLAEIMRWVDDWLHLPGRREGPGRTAMR